MDQNKSGQTEFHCKYCGNVINPDNMFCSSCGAPITFINHPNSERNSKKTEDENRQESKEKKDDLDDLPVIDTDEIFRDIDYSTHINTDFDKKEDELPVIDMEGLFDDVPFADTSSHYHKRADQYYNMNEPKKEENNTASSASMEEKASEQAEKEQEAEPNEEPAKGRSTIERKQNQAGKVSDEQTAPPIDRGEDADEEPVKKGKKKRRLFGVLLAGIATGILVWYFAFYSSKKNADLLDLCNIKFTGVNGKGNVELTFNERCDLYDDFAVVDNTAACEELKKIKFVATPNTEVSNGDTVTVRADYSDVDLKKYKIRVRNDTKQVVVSGLKDSAEYDLFSGIRVTFSGYNGYGEAVIDTTGCDEFAKENVKYSFEGSPEKLKNGDVIVVKADVDESVLEKNYYSVTAEKKDYTVEGLLVAKAYDVFENLSIMCTGVSPKLVLSVDTSKCVDYIKNNVKFSLSKSENVKEGEEVTIRASFDEEDAKKNGYKFVSTAKTVKISDVSSYLPSLSSTQASELDHEIMAYLEKSKTAGDDSNFFEEKLDALFDDGNSYTYESSSGEVADSYFLYGENENPMNSYMLVVKYTVQAKCTQTGEVKETAIYAEASIANIYTDGEDGTLHYDSPSEVVTDTDGTYFRNQLNGRGYSVTKVD